MECNKTELIAQGRHTCTDLLETLDRFTPESFNETHPQGGWTAGQIAEHLLLSGSIVETITGGTATTQRPADQHVETLAAIFLDFAVKMQSPDFIIPAEKNYDHQEMITRLKTIWSKLKEGIRLLDLDLLCVDAEFPGIGQLTRLEWIWFYIFHTQRHNRQLKALLTPAPTHHRLPLPGR